MCVCVCGEVGGWVGEVRERGGGGGRTYFYNTGKSANVVMTMQLSSCPNRNVRSDNLSAKRKKKKERRREKAKQSVIFDNNNVIRGPRWSWPESKAIF